MLMAYLSNTGLHVVPVSFERHTPPPAVPTQSVVRSPGTPSMQEMRPVITPGARARARRPSNVSESIFQASGLDAGLEAGLVAGLVAGLAPWGRAGPGRPAGSRSARASEARRRAAGRGGGHVGMAGDLVGAEGERRAARPAHLPSCGTAPRNRSGLLGLLLLALRRSLRVRLLRGVGLLGGINLGI